MNFRFKIKTFSELFSQTRKGTKRPFTAFHGRPNKKFKRNTESNKTVAAKGSRFSKNKNPSSKFKDKTNSHKRDFRPIGIAKQRKR